jgi:similar to spore coat protein
MSGQLPLDVIGISAVGAAKQKVMAYTGAILECASPDLRQILMQHLQDCYREQEQFGKLVEQRGWYTPHLTPEGLVQQAMQQASQALS